MKTPPVQVLIVDDEPLARDTLQLLMEDRDDAEVVGMCGDGAEAVDAISRMTPDLVFLDVQMPELDGFDVIQTVGVDQMPPVVFVTAYDQYALKAFEVHALDYLLKPFDDERFRETLDHAVLQVRRPHPDHLQARLASLLEERSAQVPRRVLLKTDGAVQVVNLDAIDWVEAAGDYMMVHVGEETHWVRETMQELHARFGGDTGPFVRVHRSSMVNVNRIAALHPQRNGDYELDLACRARVRVSRRYWDQLEAALMRGA